MRTGLQRAGILAGAVVILATPAGQAGTINVGPQVRIDNNGGTAAANETTIATTDLFPNEIVAGWNDWRESGGGEIIRMGVGVSMDGGQTWNDFLVRPPAPYRSSVEGDPMTAYDNRTGNLWVGAISFGGNGGVFVARKPPGQSTFEPSVMARVTGSADKCWMAAGPRPGEPDTTRLYIAYNQGLLISDDLGNTWTGPRFIASGIGFLPRVGPNGELYVAYWDFGSGMMIARSFDGGNSFNIRRAATRLDVWGTQDGSRFPGNFRVPSLFYIAVDPNDGTVYGVYFDTTNIVNGQRNVDVYFTRSEDQGLTWTTPRVINQDNDPPGDQFFTWLEVDRNGRLHLLFMDSRNVVQNDNTQHGMFDNYYAFSDDRGDTWTEFRLTPNSYDSNDDGLNRGSSQFLGDYLGLAVGADRVYPCYLDTSAGDPDIFTNVISVPEGIPGDFDGDGDVDLSDFAFLAACYTGSDVPCSGSCCDADLDGDGDVDIADFAIFTANFTGSL